MDAALETKKEKGGQIFDLRVNGPNVCLSVCLAMPGNDREGRLAEMGTDKQARALHPYVTG